MRLKTASLYLRIFTTLLLVLTSYSLAYAQNCDSLVVDEAGVFKGGIGSVEEAAQKLVNSGADVRVRTVTTFGSAGNLDQYESRLEKSCSSWQDSNGVRKNNLIVLAISLRERKTGLYYGSQWNGALSGGWLRIQSDHMNPRFKSGDFVGGFVAGINEVNRMVDIYLHPEPVQQTSPPVVIIQPQSQPSEPVDLSGLWRVLGWLVSLGALAGLGFLLWQLKLRSEKRRAAQQKAVLRKQAASSRVNELSDSLSALEACITGLKGNVSDDDLNPVVSNLGKIKRLIDSAVLKYSDVDKSAGDPSRSRLSEAEYEATERSYDGVLKALDDANISLGVGEELVQNLKRMMAEIPSQIQEARSLLDATSQEIGLADKKGFITGHLLDSVAKSREFIAEAEKTLREKNFSEASRHVSDSKKSSLSALEAARDLPKRKEALERELSGLNSRVDNIKRSIIEGKTVFDRISDEYAQSSWKSVKGNGTEAVKRVNQSVEKIIAAEIKITMAHQEWDKAEVLFKEIATDLDQAESLMRSIVSLEQNLQTARKDSQKEVDTADEDIKKARDYIHKYDDDIKESLESDLKKAEKDLAVAVSELKNDKPDYFDVVKYARLANEEADKILAEARSEHETAERLRQKAAGALRDAKSRVSKAKEYIEDHSGDVDSDAKTKLKKAKKVLEEAESTNDLNMLIVLSGQANDFGKDAFKLAEDDVSSAHKSSSYDWGSSSSGSSYSSPSSDGSSDWGGGGGSSSFSFGGGGGGGGSSSW